jgi:glucokinase
MFVALDVGGSSIKSGCVVVSPDSGQLVGVGKVMIEPLDHHADQARLVVAFVTAIDNTTGIAAHEPPNDHIERIAIAIPDPFNHHDGVSLMRHKFAALYGVRLGDEISHLLTEHRHPAAGAPLRWCNDAAAAVAGEAMSGAGRGHARVFGVTLGTGLGAAFIVGGHVVEQIAGYTIPETYSLRTEHGLTADESLSARAFVERAKHGGTPEAFGTELGQFLAPIVAAIDADIVIVGGGGLTSFNQFAPSLQAELAVPVAAAQLDRWAPLIGAVALTTQ